MAGGAPRAPRRLLDANPRDKFLAMTNDLFTPIALRGITLANRIVVPPLCQYSSDEGVATDWHMQHLPALALSGAGLVVFEMTDVEPIGRITPYCAGLWSDAQEAVLARVIASCRKYGQAKLGIQIAHAGRKASCSEPWKGGKFLPSAQGGWQTIAPSAIPFSDGYGTPRAMTREDMTRVLEAFVGATRRAARLGFDSCEMHGAHGYLISSFFSPLSNRRDDMYGGSLENRMRFPLEVFRAMREVWPQDKPLGVRLSCVDWAEGGTTIEDTIVFAQALKAAGCDFICCSSGGVVAVVPPAVRAGYQVEFAARIRREVGIATRAVGMIFTGKQADAILAEGKADMVAVGRGYIDDPRWAWHAGDELGVIAPFPPQADRVRSPNWIRQKIEAQKLP
jgi:2,4-dienoyl-CoA reductase-like NADH-dependent reductase (Old Yellow Enzyme family)